jgi:hypothetical protein
VCAFIELILVRLACGLLTVLPKVRPKIASESSLKPHARVRLCLGFAIKRALEFPKLYWGCYLLRAITRSFAPQKTGSWDSTGNLGDMRKAHFKSLFQIPGRFAKLFPRNSTLPLANTDERTEGPRCS